MPLLSKSELENLIAENKTGLAIDKLLEIANASNNKGLRKQVNLKSAELNRLEKQDRNGTISHENKNISINRININLLQIIEKLPDNLRKEVIETGNNQKKKPVRKYVVLLAVLLATFTVFAIIKRFYHTENLQQKSEITAIPMNNSLAPNSIFKVDDQNHFNVLIIRFEDYIAGEDTYCIGRAVEEHLNVIEANEELSMSLNNVYVSDSILPPKSQEDAIDIQKRHHSDLIIYGLTRQVEQNCAGAEVCFRYKIAEKVIANVGFDDKIKPAKHDAEYKQTTPMDIEEGKLQIDSISMKYWISSLVNIKANKMEEAFLDLGVLTEKNTDMLSNKDKSVRHLNTGNIYYNLKDYQKAIDEFDKAILLNPYDNISYNTRGFVYYYLKEYRRAIDDYDIAILLDPDYSNTYIDRGIAYLKLKEYQRAIDDYNIAIQLDPDYAHAYNNRGVAYRKLKEYQKAIEDYDKAILVNPDFADAYYNRGNAYKDLKDYQSAIDYYDKAIELDPDFYTAYNNLGYAFIKQKKFSLAKKNLEKSKELDPDNSFVYIVFACYYTLQSQEELALQNLENVLYIQIPYTRNLGFHRNFIIFTITKYYL